jgi:CDP-6-deoxy-D-xylo-4-hexulose-3-dehydrase
MFAKYGVPGYCHTTKAFDGKVLYAGFYWDQNEIKAAVDSLFFDSWFVSGPSITKFENEFVKKLGSAFGVMVNSGSSANLVAFAAAKRHFKWNDGDSILVSACSFPTTVAVIPQNGLKPDFVDINIETLNFDLDQLESKIHPRTKAILIAPVLASPPDMDRLLFIAKKYNLILIGDLCDSIGSKYGGNDLNKYCAVSTCSFFSSHHLSVGNGGMVFTDNEDLAILARKISRWFKGCYCTNLANTSANGVCGKRFSKWLDSRPDLVYDHRMSFEGLGYNLQNLSLTGAIGLAQLSKWDIIHEKRKDNHSKIKVLFERYISGVKFQKVLDKADPSWFGLGLICDDKDLKEKLVAHLEKNKINTRPYFCGNILCHNEFCELGDWKEYPNSNLVLERVFFVGVAPHIEEPHLKHIEKVLSGFVA